MTFRFSNTKVHLTYKTHIKFEEYKTFIKKFGDLKMWSFVHEDGDKDEKAATPYAHTHVFLWFKKKIDTTNARFFDFLEIHPNAQNKRGLDWAKIIVQSYHLGNKTKADGKKYYIKPIFLFQEGVEDWKIEEDMWLIAAGAPDLQSGCLELGFVPKSISDVKLIQSESKKRKADTIDDDVDIGTFKTINWDRKKALILRGPSGTCKTNWAIAQFKNAMKVEDLDELKHLPDGCDGIIFDECLFNMCSKKTMVSLLDYKQDRTIRTRNTNAKIPRGMSKIFTCNEYEHPFGEAFDRGGSEAVTSRFNILEVKAGDLVADAFAR